MIKVGVIYENQQFKTDIKISLENQLALSTKEPIPPVEVLFETDDVNLLKKDIIHPHVIILEVVDTNTQIVRDVKIAFPEADIIVLTDFNNIIFMRECFRNGATCYLLKQTCLSNLLLYIITTYNGGSIVSPFIMREFIDNIFKVYQQGNLLTAREQQIANGIIEGLSYKLIADRYSISLDTVRVYIKRIYRKLNINSKGELIAQQSFFSDKFIT